MEWLEQEMIPVFPLGEIKDTLDNAAKDHTKGGPND
jgi:hypothetical protein